MLLIEAGAWQLATPLLVEERRYTRLREEVDDFIGLVRELNDAAVRARRQEEGAGAGEGGAPNPTAEVLEEMHASVDRMAELAGRPDTT